MLLTLIVLIVIYVSYKLQVICYVWSFIKRQTSGTSSDNAWQRMTTNDNEWYNVWQRMTASDNEWQRVTKSGATSDKEWQRVIQRVTTNDSEWQRMITSDKEWQRVIMSGVTSDKEWQPVATNGNEWQRVTAVVQRMKTALYTSKNGWLQCFQWENQINFYFKGWMAAIRVVK